MQNKDDKSPLKDMLDFVQKVEQKERVRVVNAYVKQNEDGTFRFNRPPLPTAR